MKQNFTILAALIAGLIGGFISSRITRASEQNSAQIVRARRFELVNEVGQVISLWGVDKGDNAVLAFGSRGLAAGSAGPAGLENPDNQLATFGLLGTDSPALKMRGADGKTRARLYLSTDGKPFLLMEDETGPRVSLGIEQSDTPGPDDNDWTLTFYPERARIGMFTVKEAGKKYVRGVFLVNKDKVIYPNQQPK